MTNIHIPTIYINVILLYPKFEVEIGSVVVFILVYKPGFTNRYPYRVPTSSGISQRSAVHEDRQRRMMMRIGNIFPGHGIATDSIYPACWYLIFFQQSIRTLTVCSRYMIGVE